VYHRERICFSSTLSCIKEAEKITKPLTLSAGANFNQPGNFWARQPISINQANFGLVSPFQSTRQLLGSSAHFNQPGNFWAHQPFSINQATLDNTWLGTCFFYLPQQLTPPSSPTAKDK
jgi:hypothetical protein